jgi:hypothetical protein
VILELIRIGDTEAVKDAAGEGAATDDDSGRRQTEVMAVIHGQAATFRARFVVITIEPDGSNATELGWGLALPDHVFAHLPGLGLTDRFRRPRAAVPQPHDGCPG